jgi:F0F1-type ATP synthase membrane subunit b/b'
MDFLGNISMRLIGALCTVGILAAVYFFIVKPAADTTTHAIDSVSPAIGDISKQINEAQDQAKAAQQQANQTGDGGQAAGVDLSKLRKCMAKASKHQNVAAVQRCAERYGAQ